MPPMDTTKPLHSLGFRLQTHSTKHRNVPSLHATSMNFPNTMSSQHTESRRGGRDPRSYIIAEREYGSRNHRMMQSADAGDLPKLKTGAKARKELDQDKYFH